MLRLLRRFGGRGWSRRTGPGPAVGHARHAGASAARFLRSVGFAELLPVPRFQVLESSLQDLLGSHMNIIVQHLALDAPANVDPWPYGSHQYILE